MFVSSNRPDCIFNIGDHVMIGDMMKGVVVKIEYSEHLVHGSNRKVKPLGWVIDVRPYYFWSNRDNMDLGSSVGIMTHKESELEFETSELRDKKLRKLGI